MSEYWKSLAKKYCEICKIWIADNKSSIAIHEGGKNHKEKVAEHLKSIRKKNDVKNAEEQKHNKEIAAIERAAMAAMDKDIDNNPSLKRQYNITGNYQPAMVSSSISDETPPEKKIKKESKAVPVKKPPPALPPSAVKSPEPEKPEQQAKIGKWQPIEKPIAVVESVVENIDLQLPTSTRVASKFSQMSVEQLQYELQKADREFRSKGQAVQAPTTAQIAARTDVAVSRSQSSSGSKPVSKWKVVTENSGFREEEPEQDQVVKTEVKEECFNAEASEPEIPEEPKSESTVEAEVKKEVVEEKVVTLSSSSKRNKVVSFKKREKASANFKERSKDD